jgi:hypothetical protein
VNERLAGVAMGAEFDHTLVSDMLKYCLGVEGCDSVVVCGRDM